MNSNKTKNNITKDESLEEISKAFFNLKDYKKVYLFLLELLTKSELNDISKRWRILNMLNDGFSQREIAAELSVSLCKITRGAKIIKDKNSVIAKILKK